MYLLIMLLPAKQLKRFLFVNEFHRNNNNKYTNMNLRFTLYNRLNEYIESYFSIKYVYLFVIKKILHEFVDGYRWM